LGCNSDSTTNPDSRVAPSITQFRIGSGETTSSLTVTLNNTCEGDPTEYMASEKSDFSGANWQTYSTSPSFTLSEGNGLKTVYFKVRNSVDSSSPATDTITLYILPNVQEKTIMLPGNVPLIIVAIPGGSFMMGRDPSENLSSADEDPRHSVSINTSFMMGKYEVTKRQWKAVMGTEPWSGQVQVLNDPESPAVYITWDMAKNFITALNAALDMTFRLPSEAEWEYACRAGTSTAYYWGNDDFPIVINNYAWYNHNAVLGDEEYARVVGQKLPNPFGLYDMSGNVCEWCEDDWHWGYANMPTGSSAWVDNPRSDRRIARSGSWRDESDKCRSANRDSYYPTLSNGFVGFRLVR
jgi:formylglycine-generating enzyme required for sulfatase activity